VETARGFGMALPPRAREPFGSACLVVGGLSHYLLAAWPGQGDDGRAPRGRRRVAYTGPH
jgi:hypothetical protein